MTTPDNQNPDTADTAVLDDATPSQGTDADFVADTKRSFFSRLYTGTGAFEIVGKRKMWYIVTGVLLLICVASIAIRGFTFGIDFEGGTQMSVPVVSSEITADSVETVVTDASARSRNRSRPPAPAAAPPSRCAPRPSTSSRPRR